MPRTPLRRRRSPTPQTTGHTIPTRQFWSCATGRSAQVAGQGGSVRIVSSRSARATFRGSERRLWARETSGSATPERASEGPAGTPFAGASGSMGLRRLGSMRSFFGDGALRGTHWRVRGGCRTLKLNQNQELRHFLKSAGTLSLSAPVRTVTWAILGAEVCFIWPFLCRTSPDRLNFA